MVWLALGGVACSGFVSMRLVVGGWIWWFAYALGAVVL